MLDTNTVSHIIKGTMPAVRQHLVAVPIGQLCISAITHGELMFGIAKRPEAKRLHEVVHEFLLRVDILPWDSTVAENYGVVRAGLERQGKPLGNLDMMIAAHAVSTRAVLITNDQAFHQVEHLQVEDWTR
jgi:tRNA(fMet)-specific endonuclease VapC